MANLLRHTVTKVGSNKLLPKFIGLFRVLRRIGNAYTIELPRKMRTHPTFYVGRLRPYYQYGASSGEEILCAQASSIDTSAHDAGSQPASEARLSPREAEVSRRASIRSSRRERCSRSFAAWIKE